MRRTLCMLLSITVYLDREQARRRHPRVVESAGVWGTANVPFIFLVVTLVGALVASRRPTNPIGWISLAAGLALALFNAAGEYAIYALLSQPASLPGAQVAAWLREWIWVPFVGLVGIYLVLLFPDGRLPSSRWRVVAGLAVVALVFSSLSKALLPGRLEETPGVVVANPFGIEAAREVLELLGTIGFFLLPSAVRAHYQQLMDGWNQGSRLIHRST